MRKIITTLVATLALITSQAGELFVKFNSTSGSYYATFDNQAVYNNTGIFRFFEVTGGQHYLLIRHQATQVIVANVPVQIQYNQKLIGEINVFGQFITVATENLNYISWYAQQHPYVYHNPNAPGHGTHHPHDINSFRILNDIDYQAFKKHLRNEAFDSGKLATALTFVKNTRMSAEQIKGIAKEFTFDDNRLKWAKYAYDFCYNPMNYYQVSNAFTFSSNRNELKEYIACK